MLVVVTPPPRIVEPLVMLIVLNAVLAPTEPLKATVALPALTVKAKAPSTALLKRIALFVVLTVVAAARATGPANVISAGLVAPVVMAPDNVVRPVCVALPKTKLENLPPLPNIESVPASMAAVIFKVLPTTPTPIVLLGE